MSVLGFVCNQYIGRHSGANLGTIMAVTANTLDFMICFYKSKKKKKAEKKIKNACSEYYDQDFNLEGI